MDSLPLALPGDSPFLYIINIKTSFSEIFYTLWWEGSHVFNTPCVFTFTAYLNWELPYSKGPVAHMVSGYYIGHEVSSWGWGLSEIMYESFLAALLLIMLLLFLLSLSIKSIPTPRWASSSLHYWLLGQWPREDSTEPSQKDPALHACWSDLHWENLWTPFFPFPYVCHFVLWFWHAFCQQVETISLALELALANGKIRKCDIGSDSEMHVALCFYLLLETLLHHACEPRLAWWVMTDTCH